MAAPREHPPSTEYATFYREYIAELPLGDVLSLMRAQAHAIAKLPALVPPSQEAFAYAEGKWTVRQVVGHLCDTERIFGYRAFRFAHSDPTPLPGFDENSYVASSSSNRRALRDLVEELGFLRNANLRLFSNLDESQWRRMGTANSFPVSVRALAFIIVGHADHHLKVLRDRYGLDRVRSAQGSSDAPAGT
jgi:hypothetical protein